MTVRPIEPDPIKIEDVMDSVEEGLLALVEIAKVDLMQTYQTFEEANTPEFKTEGPKSDGKDLVVEYSTEDTPYVWIDDGTVGPYDITAKNPSGMLKFKVGGSTKTKAGSFAAMPGSPGTEFRQQQTVTHPGIKPRNFSEQEAEKLDQVADGVVQNSINSAKTY